MRCCPREHEMTCRFCGEDKKDGQEFDKWVKPTFTDHDKLLPGEIVCNDCLFWFDESSTELAAIIGKDKPQRMRNYSHFIVNGEWIPLSKADKSKMTDLLLNGSFPELAAIAESGQKHIIFRAVRNPQGGTAGWIQFEEQQFWLRPKDLRTLLNQINPALSIFAKGEFETGQYKPHRILQFGLDKWHGLEETIRPLRGTTLLSLALFLAQKEDDGNAGNSSESARDSLAGDKQRLQEPVQANDLGAIREHGTGQRLHQQSRQVYQLALFENAGDDSGEIDESS